MGILIDVLPLEEGADYLVYVGVSEPVLVLSLLELLRGVDEQYVAAGIVLPEDYHAGRY